MRAALEANAATAPKLNRATAQRAADATAQLRTASPSGSTSTTATTRCSAGGWAMPFKQTGRGRCRIRDVPARQGRGGRRAGAAGARQRFRRSRRRRRRSTPRCRIWPRSSRFGQDEMRDDRRRASTAGGPAAAAAADAAAGRRRADATAPAAAPPVARQRVLQRLADRAEVARLRPALAQRAGRLPLHQVDGRDGDQARRRDDSAGTAAQGRHVGHQGPAARPHRPHSRPHRQHDSVHARAAHRAGEQGIRVVRGGNEEGVARAGLRRRLEEGARAHQADRRAARRAAAHDHGPASTRPSPTCAPTISSPCRPSPPRRCT